MSVKVVLVLVLVVVVVVVVGTHSKNLKFALGNSSKTKLQMAQLNACSSSNERTHSSAVYVLNKNLSENA